jgi:adenine/guanine phosphoribosyltransferase-like PRPP-binding protein
MQSVQPLMDLLAKETKPQVRQYAVKALGSIGDAQAIGLLERIANDENEQHYTRDSAKAAILRCRNNNSFVEDNRTPDAVTRNPQRVTIAPPHESRSTQQPDPIASYLSSSHPRSLTGNWHTGFALDFHSSYKGADWNRSSIGDLVFRLKYQSDSTALPALIEHTLKLFASHTEMNQFDIILPVPSSTQREFSPVHEFCKALSKTFNKPMQASIIKTRQTNPQKEMQTLPQKRDNVAGAFALNDDITGKRILLVDDLFDSGSTLEEITKLLLKNKAARVNALTFTRTIHADA